MRAWPRSTGRRWCRPSSTCSATGSRGSPGTGSTGRQPQLTSEHGVLGRRWIYDAAHDPVAVTQLLDFICGETEAQHQNRSDTPDPSVGRHRAATGRPSAPTPLRVTHTETGTSIPVDGTGASTGSLDLVRVLVEGADDEALGRVVVDWTRPDGTAARGAAAVVR